MEKKNIIIRLSDSKDFIYPYQTWGQEGVASQLFMHRKVNPESIEEILFTDDTETITATEEEFNSFVDTYKAIYNSRNNSENLIPTSLNINILPAIVGIVVVAIYIVLIFGSSNSTNTHVDADTALLANNYSVADYQATTESTKQQTDNLDILIEQDNTI